MDDVLTIVLIIGGVITVLGALVAVILFLVRVGGELAVHKKALEENVKDTNRAHDKIRNVEQVQAAHATDLAVLKATLDYIKVGIDDIKTALSDHIKAGQ